jgi:hypothetical protein
METTTWLKGHITIYDPSNQLGSVFHPFRERCTACSNPREISHSEDLSTIFQDE